ncbi:MAG: bacteriohemerythrin [Geobacteraceae bacterium]|nr:bacteriohemerythrin [Geobacteraceae bacterium]
MAISWRTELEIGITEIDEQHKHLVESFNVFLRACRDGKGSSELLRLMEFLDEYVIKHFNAEEKLQVKLAYPDHESHRLQHLGFIKRIQELKNQLMPEVPPEINQVISTNSMLLDWLVKHISGSDKQFGRYLEEVGYSTSD